MESIELWKKKFGSDAVLVARIRELAREQVQALRELAKIRSSRALEVGAPCGLRHTDQPLPPDPYGPQAPLLDLALDGVHGYSIESREFLRREVEFEITHTPIVADPNEARFGLLQKPRKVSAAA